MRLDDGKFGKFSVRLDFGTSYTLRKRVRGDPGLPITTNRRRVVFNRRLSGVCRPIRVEPSRGERRHQRKLASAGYSFTMTCSGQSTLLKLSPDGGSGKRGGVDVDKELCWIGANGGYYRRQNAADAS